MGSHRSYTHFEYGSDGRLKRVEHSDSPMPSGGWGSTIIAFVVLLLILRACS